MVNIRVGRYAYCSEWQGWIEPEDLSWIAFIKDDGIPVFFLHRDPETGAVLPRPNDVTPEARESGGKYPGEVAGESPVDIVEPPR